MKKEIAIPVALVLSLGLCPVAYANDDSLVSVGEGKSIDVVARFESVQDEPDVYSIDVAWEDMRFLYRERGSKQWDRRDHSYVDAAESSWIDDTAAITVTNHSNVHVTAAFDYAALEGTGVSGAFDIASKDLPAGVIGKREEAASVTSTLVVKGMPSDVIDALGVKIGTATISIG